MNQQSNGQYEVHVYGCTYHKPASFKEDLGWYANCYGAVQAAKILHYLWDIDGCAFCCPSCNNG